MCRRVSGALGAVGEQGHGWVRLALGLFSHQPFLHPGCPRGLADGTVGAPRPRGSISRPLLPAGGGSSPGPTSRPCTAGSGLSCSPWCSQAPPRPACVLLGLRAFPPLLPELLSPPRGPAQTSPPVWVPAPAESLPSGSRGCFLKPPASSPPCGSPCRLVHRKGPTVRRLEALGWGWRLCATHPGLLRPGRVQGTREGLAWRAVLAQPRLRESERLRLVGRAGPCEPRAAGRPRLTPIIVGAPAVVALSLQRGLGPNSHRFCSSWFCSASRAD